MAKKKAEVEKAAVPAGRPSAVVDTRVIYCGDNLEQLGKLPDGCVDLVYIDPPFNSNRNYEVFWGETKEKRSFDDRHASTQAYIEFMRPRCEQLHRVLKETGSFYFHCDDNASHYVKVMLDQIFGENSSLMRSSGNVSLHITMRSKDQSTLDGCMIRYSFTPEKASSTSSNICTSLMMKIMLQSFIGTPNPKPEDVIV